MRTDEELRDQGWDEADITAYRRGAQEAESRAGSFQMPAARPAPEPPARYLLADPGRFAGNSDRAKWRQTLGGRLAQLRPEPDEARELAQARELADQHELTYGTRPAMAQCLAKVQGLGTGGGTVIEGTSAEIGAMFRQVGLRFAVVHEVLAPEGGGVVFGPAGGPELHGDPVIAAQAHSYLTRPRTFG